MKIIPLAISSIIFCLSLVPCSDCGADDANTVNAHIDQVFQHDHPHAYYIQGHSDNQHGHSHDSHDHCTPFCTCQCCGLTLDLVDADVLALQSPLHFFNYTHSYSFNYAYDHSGLVWHPPITSAI